MKLILFALLGAVLIGSIHCQWREVDEPRSVTVTGNATGALQVGSVVQLVCTAAGAVLPYSTLTWTSKQGNVQLSAGERGYSPLALTLPVTPELHGAELYCSAPFSDSEGGRYFSYTVTSEVVKLTVAGAGTPQTPYKPGHVEMEALSGTTHRVGDSVAFYCTTYDIPYTVVDVVQAKGNYEIQLHSGLQQWREVRFTVSAADDGSELFCRVSSTDPADYRRLYTLVSNRVPLSVSP